MKLIHGWVRAALPAALALAAAAGMAYPAMARAHAQHASRRASPVAVSRATGHVGPVPTIVQTLNNCGPASIAEVLAYWGVGRTQAQVQAAVRADNAPWGMAPFGVPGYARSVGMRALLGAGGTERLIKALISNGFPVIAGQWVSMADHIRHYRPIVAYDDRQRLFLSSDPYLGANHVIGYGDFERMWAVSDGRFIVLAPPSRQSLLAAVLASAGWSRTGAYRRDLAWQQDRLRKPETGSASAPARYYGLPSIAWDQMELGAYGAARATLHRAALQGASPVVIGWITSEMTYRERGAKQRRRG